MSLDELQLIVLYPNSFLNPSPPQTEPLNPFSFPFLCQTQKHLLILFVSFLLVVSLLLFLYSCFFTLVSSLFVFKRTNSFLFSFLLSVSFILALDFLTFYYPSME
ncbi:hypothetical protein PGT21_005036 [Puccinia graminis f. sp. tritici]|uniref:Uncharacterized protein n=1 Tax=Puccinia graminis f. sp. tritici TaxID=56615 RepID=A0A5B0M577_PUCGR|nr:hypothetical protein PGT21_005036 [Puccinia graminis f. sp. tritici]KAA1123168.1 hypothetical protein PGTUg99_018499 [Puccinia graminis f. sp. tritici]